MADYDLQYQDTHIDALLATANELKTAGYIYKGVATPSTNPGTPTERVAYLASEPGTYTNFGGIVITRGLYSLTYASGTWTGTQMQAGSDIEVVQTTGQSTSDVMSQKAVTDEILYIDGYDLSQASYPTNIIGSTNKWAAVANTSSILIPVSEGQRLRITGNGNSAGTIYAFLQTNNTTTGSTPSFATGYSGRISKGGSETFDITIPPTTHYLWFLYKNASGTMMPYVDFIGNVADLKKEVNCEKGIHQVGTWRFDIAPANPKRAIDYTLYYIESGQTITIPNGMSVGIQTFNEDGAYGNELSFSGWQTGTYTFPQDGWYRLLAKNSSDTNVSASEVASLNAMVLKKYTKDYPLAKFKLCRMDRLTGRLVLYDHETYIAPTATTQTLNDRFYELDGNLLSIVGNSEIFLVFFDSQYKRVSDTITTLGGWKDHISNYDYSSLGAKYVRIVAQKGNNYQNVYAIFTSGVKNNTYTSADVTVSVNSMTEIVADAADATGAIQQALFLAYIRGGKAILYEDDYILNSTTPWTDNANAPKCCLWIPHIIDVTNQYSNEIQFFAIEGSIQPVSYGHGVRIILGEDVYNNVTDVYPLSVIRSEYQTKNNVIGAEGGVAAIALKNMNILLPNNQKAIITIDLRYTHACNIENLNTMAGYSTLNWGHTNPPPIANPKCVGIRGLIGANWSVLNTFTNIEAFGYYIGIDWCGEHLTGRNISVKYNYYGMTFGVLQWYGHQGHPIVLMNVLDEHSVCLPKFGSYGAYCHQMINILGYNLMFPSEATQGDITAMDARHHKAVDDNDDKYAWNGFIYYTNANDQSDGSIVGHNIQDFSFFEEGGFNVRCVNTCNYRVASDASLALIEPNFLQEVWSRTHNKLCIFDGTNWKSADGEVIYEYPTYSLSGVVTSGGSPVSGASVKYTYQGVDYTTTTGSDGSYSLTVPQFAGVIEVSKSGYITFGRRIKMTANTTLNVELNAE